MINLTEVEKKVLKGILIQQNKVLDDLIENYDWIARQDEVVKERQVLGDILNKL